MFFRNYWELYCPLIESIVIALVVTVVVIGIHYLITQPTDHPSQTLTALAASIGFAYSVAVEYAHHGFIMHGKYRFLRFFSKGHIYHHKLFTGTGNFTTNDPGKLKTAITFWATFPVLFIGHYLALLIPLFVFGYSPYLHMAFFVGVFLQFIYFEVTHYYMHKKSEDGEYLLLQTIGAGVRLCNNPKKIAHHLIHHNQWGTNFGVTLPPLLDWVGGTESKRQ